MEIMPDHIRCRPKDDSALYALWLSIDPLKDHIYGWRLPHIGYMWAENGMPEENEAIWPSDRKGWAESEACLKA